jgi:hypothetical protein
LFGLKQLTKKNHSGSRSAEAHSRGPADFFSHEQQVYNYFWKPYSTRNMLKLLHKTVKFPLYSLLSMF